MSHSSSLLRTQLLEIQKDYEAKRRPQECVERNLQQTHVPQLQAADRFGLHLPQQHGGLEGVQVAAEAERVQSQIQERHYASVDASQERVQAQEHEAIDKRDD